MTYEQVRDAAQLREYDVRIDGFIGRYRDSSVSEDKRQTVIFFPGGAASRLKRSRVDYRDVDDRTKFDIVWLTLGTILGDALHLLMKRQQGVYMEDDERVVIAGTSVTLLGVSPYHYFRRWCREHDIDYLVYGYDWRRPQADTATYFADRFLPHFQQRVRNACGIDPLRNFSLVGHCFGGMIVNLVLRRNTGLAAGVRKAVTVATPFYGYAGQLHRWFEGEPVLNDLGKAAMLRVISSFPSFYTLPFLDAETDRRDGEELRHDACCKLQDYPSVDADDSKEHVDPYDPQERGDCVRYPEECVTGFSRDELAYGLAAFHKMVAPMGSALLDKFFNLRGVLPKIDTVGSIRWGWIDRAWEPVHGRSPITSDSRVAGDDTQPCWTTRLVELQQTYPSHCITVPGWDTEHMFIMNSKSILEHLADILGVSRAMTPIPQLPDPAPMDDALAFITELHAYATRRSADVSMLTAEEIDAFLQGYSPRSIKGYARRILIELLQRTPESQPDGVRA